MRYSVEELRRISQEHIGSSWGRIPLILKEGKGVIVKDIEGKEYIDCTAQAWTLSVGHSHPKVIDAVKKQSEKLACAFFMYDNVPMLELVKRIMEITPDQFNKVIFALSGSVAIEGAMRLAMRYTGGQDFITLYHAYHGRTFATSAMSYTYPAFVSCKQGMERFTPKPIRVPNFYCYRCYFGRQYPECKLACLDFVEHAIRHGADTKVAGVLLEPIQANGGHITPPPGYLERLRRICTENDIPLIYDEIQTGIGRCGKMFASEVYNTFPDILVIGKGLGAGFPISAIVTNEKYSSFEAGEWGFTHAGHPVSCAAALAAIEVLIEENLPENAVKMGKIFMDGLDKLSKKYSLIGDVRGKGLMIGIEIVKDRNSKEPAIEKAQRIVDKAQERGVIFGKSGLGLQGGNVVKIKPPLCITKEEVGKVLDVFESTLDEMC